MKAQVSNIVLSIVKLTKEKASGLWTTQDS